MKARTVFVALGMALTVSVFAQEKTAAFRIPVRHADPWMIKAMLEGKPVSTPEISGIVAFGGAAGQIIAGVGSILQNGTLVVNPTDNSLWWFPKSKG